MIARPLVLLLLVVVVGLIAAYALVQQRRGRFALQFSDASLFDSVAPRRPGWRRHVVAACFLTVVTLLVVSVAGPVRSRDVLRERAIVILTVDTSLSMGAVDVDPTRIGAAQEAARQFLEGAPAGVDVGLVSFHEAPIVEVPPTPDRLTVVDAIDALELGPYTNTGDAISVSISTLERTIEQLQVSDESAPPAVVVLLSDGEPTIGRPIEDAIAEAKQAGIPVSTVSLGTPTGQVTIEDPDRPGTFFDVEVPVNETTLRTVAEATGGSFFATASAEELAAVYRDIGTAVGFETVDEDISVWFTTAALVLAIVTGMLSLRWFQRLP